MGKRYGQVTIEERCAIAGLQAAGRSVRQIAAALDRAPSTVARELKEEIGWLKAVFAILVAIAVSLVGWLAQNYDDAPIFLQIVCSVAAVVMTGGIIWVNRVAYRKIDELEEL